MKKTCLCILLFQFCILQLVNAQIKVFAPVAVSKTVNIPVFVHTMPWFETPATNNGAWGIHWTMANENPNIIDGTGRRQIASYYYPMIGPYASSDTNVIDYQLLLMKFAGIDGPIIDWSGTMNVDDYPKNVQNAEAIMSRLDKIGLKYAVIYEDNNLALGGAPNRVAQAQQDMLYLQNNYFNRADYARINGAPLLLDFGPQAITDPADWATVFSVLNTMPSYIPLWGDQHVNAAGASGKGEFSWNYQSNAYLYNYYATHTVNGIRFGSAYIGYNDFYAAGGWGAGNGYTITPSVANFQQTLDETFAYNLPNIQLVTWNDYGEGTMMEPTREFGFGCLAYTQQKLGVSGITQDDFELVDTFYRQRVMYAGNAVQQARLTQAFYYMVSLQLDSARSLLLGTQTLGSTPVISSATTANGSVGTTFNYTITASNTPTSYNATGLPAGLSVNASTGLISGTAQTGGTYSVTISATNSSGTGSATLTITITQPTTSSPYGGTAAIIPGTIQAENYDLGGQGVAYNDNDATNDGGQYRTTEGVDIETTEDVGGGYDIGWTNAGEWMQYTVNVEEAGVYTLQARVASIETGQTFTVTLDGVNISGTMTVPNTGGYQTWQTISVTTPFLTTGLHELRINETTGGYNFNYLTFINNTDEACSNANNILVADAGVAGNTYQWQVSTDNGTTYNNVSNSALYSGATTDVLTITNAPSGMYGYLYRCSINGSTAASLVTTLKFADTWTGAVNTAWEVGGNWSCGTVPDANSDVIINSGTAVINSTVTIRTLSLSAPAANLTVNTGQILTVTH